MAQIILASASPRRSELLRQAGMDFIVIPSKGEEVVTGTHPAEVVEEYKVCHFGFALRDDITVNNVACPTKIIEYIQYGIVPVLKTEKIGDFVDMGMQYISYEEFADSAPGFEQYSSMARGNFAVLDKLMQAHNDGVAELKGKLYEKFNV